eukprot:gene6985-7200_t
MTDKFSVTWPTLNEGHIYSDKITKKWLQRLHNQQITYKDTGQLLAPGTLLAAGDLLTYHRVPWIEPDAPAHFQVLHEDEHVLVICKPAGLQVLPKGMFLQRTVLGLLQLYMQQRRQQAYPSSLIPVPVHRLGRGTSGVLLCACTALARNKLTQDFKAATQQEAQMQGAADSGRIQRRPLAKKYRALVSGVVQQDQFEVCVPIGQMVYPGLSTGLFAARPLGKPARSLCQVLHRHHDSTTLVEVAIFTGRPHQIRIHMAAAGHPLVGDPLYGPGGLPLDSVLQRGNCGALHDASNVMPEEEAEGSGAGRAEVALLVACMLPLAALGVHE